MVVCSMCSVRIHVFRRPRTVADPRAEDLQNSAEHGDPEWCAGYRYFNDSGVARISGGVDSLPVMRVVSAQYRCLSGVDPADQRDHQGPLRGGAVLFAAMTDCLSHGQKIASLHVCDG